MGRAIGIDLGTTNSCAAVIENNKPTIIMYRAGSYTIPSLFAIDEGGRELVGHEAKEQAALNPQDTVFAAKRMVGRDFHSPQVEKLRQLFTYDMLEGTEGEVLVKVQDKTFDLKEISAAILKKIRNVAEEYLEDEVTNAVITVPAYFNDRQRQAVRSAGKLAGLNVLRVLNEPTSAALAYGLGKNLRQRLAVYDLGGGTFDISIIEIRDKVFEVIASGGDTYLGGIDFDDRVIGHVIEAFGLEHGIDLSTDRIAIQRIREAAERAKITLSTTQQANIEVPFIARGPNGIINLEYVLDRDQLEGLVDDLVKRTVSACESIFKDAGLGPETIDEVLIVGGQSRMPLVQSRVKTYFQKEPCKGVHPDEAVAVGAAIMAHSLTSSMGEQVTLLDVLPMAIGIAKGDGSFLPLFPRNCPIPHGRKLTLTNSKDDQKSIMLRVYQGDKKLAADNDLLGTFVFSGMRQGPRGSVRVQTWLNVDSEGILSVSAKDKDTEEVLDVKLKLRQQDLAPNLSVQTVTPGDDAPASRRSAPPPAPSQEPASQDAEKPAADAEKEAGKATAPPPASEPAAPVARFGSLPSSGGEAGTAASPPAATPPRGPGAASPSAAATELTEEDTDPQGTAPAVVRSATPTPPGAPSSSRSFLAMLLPWNWFLESEEPSPSPAASGVESPPAPAEGKAVTAEEPGCMSLLLPWNWFR